jgi:hypothetical protein
MGGKLMVEGHERRINQRKKCHFPIKLIASDSLSVVGYVANINCYGVKVDITFKTKSNNRIMDKILFNPNVALEAVEIGDKNPLKFIAPIDIIWNKYLCTNENQVYEMGFRFNLNEEQKQLWDTFYNEIAA